MTVDTFTNTFGMVVVLAAVIILKRPLNREPQDLRSSLTWQKIWPYLLFGLGLGMATAQDQCRLAGTLAAFGGAGTLSWHRKPTMKMSIY